MARLVRHEAQSPIKIDPALWPRDAAGNLKPIFVCACGLSATFPICDGRHKGLRPEQPGVLYQYDPATCLECGQSPDPLAAAVDPPAPPPA